MTRQPKESMVVLEVNEDWDSFNVSLACGLWQIHPLPDPSRLLKEPPESELLSTVDELVEDVVDRIRCYGLPHFASRMAGAGA